MSCIGKERIKLKKQTGKRLCKFDLTQICLRSSPGILHSPLAVETTVLAVLVPLEPLDILESCRTLGNKKWIVLACYYFPQHWWIPNPHVQWGEACACDNCDTSHSQMACALPSLSPFHSAPPKGQSSHRGPATLPRCHCATVTTIWHRGMLRHSPPPHAHQQTWQGCTWLDTQQDCTHSSDSKTNVPWIAASPSWGSPDVKVLR